MPETESGKVEVDHLNFGYAVHGMLKHVWQIGNNGGVAKITAKAVCQPSETEPPMVLLDFLWRHSSKAYSSDAAEAVAMADIRKMLAGFGAVKFIRRVYAQPMQWCFHVGSEKVADWIDIGRQLCQLRRHEWRFENGISIKAQPICQPSETEPAIVCLSRNSRVVRENELWTVTAKRIQDSEAAVANEIRGLFAGRCQVRFTERGGGSRNLRWSTYWEEAMD